MHADLAVTNRDDDNVTVLLGDGDGNFMKVDDFYSGDGPVPIEAADFNGDGFIDLAVGNYLSSKQFNSFDTSKKHKRYDKQKNIVIGSGHF